MTTSTGALPDVLAAVDAPPGPLAGLAAASRRPVHAYLLVGPPGAGAAEAATAFAAALLCPAGGDASCEVCRRVSAGLHPDVVHVERDGPWITIDTARQVARLAARSPVEGARKVLILHDFHLVRDAGPALLKTIEEPPESAVFVILADHLAPELVTIASRCSVIEFPPLGSQQVVEALVRDGIPADQAARLADAAGGRLDRARLLATDPAFDDRRQAWRAVPGRLDGSGATAAALADELIALLEASGEPLRVRQAGDLEALEARNARAAEVNGKVGRAARGGLKAGVKEMEERHKREQRRQRVDELRGGLAALAGVYRDRLAEPSQRVAAAAALERIAAAGEALQYNPGELLLVQALLVRLGSDRLRR